MICGKTGCITASRYGLASALADSPLGGCHRAQTVRHPSTWHRPSPPLARRCPLTRDHRTGDVKGPDGTHIRGWSG
jgi:hypothetical protein